MGEQLRRAMTVTIRGMALALAIIFVTSIATGWLYWARGAVAGWPGPHVTDALPLDELAGHDSVPLMVYLAAFGIAGVALGLLARALRFDRLRAGLFLACGVGTWLLLADAFSLVIVRQVPAGQAIRAAAGLQPVFLAAALAGASGAVLGRNVRSNHVPVLAWLVAAGGLVDLVSALFPRAEVPPWLMVGFATGVVQPVAHVLLVPAGALLLIAWRGLARRNRRAWYLAVALLGLSALLQLLRGPDYAAAVVTLLVAVALIARRHDFPFRGDPAARSSALLRGGAMLMLAVAYGILAQWVQRTAAGLPFSLGRATVDTARALVGQMPRDFDVLPGGEFARWLPFSVMSFVAVGLIWAAGVWVRPWRQRLFPDAERRRQAAQIVRRWGDDTLAPFALRSDKDWFFAGRAVIAYRVIGSIALVSGDPIGPPEDAGPALDAFLARARARGWHVGVLGASRRYLQAYRDRGLHPLYHGDEAVIDTGRFSLDGRPMRAARQATHRVERHGYQAQVVTAGDLSPELRGELLATERAWLKGGARKGFSMELDSLFRLDGDNAVFVIGRDAQQHVAGFLHLAVCAGQSLSMSTMPRRPGTPNGLDAWLVANAVSWARDHEFAHISLNFCPFAGLLGADQALPRAQRLQRRALLQLKRALDLQLDNLLRFNRQFMPSWNPRYVVVERWPDLPRTVITAMAAEGYLPHAWLVRGRRWSPAPAEHDAGWPLPFTPVEIDPTVSPVAATRVQPAGQDALHPAGQDALHPAGQDALHPAGQDRR
jgi:lysyl-tRNA synthetase class 2